MVPELPWSRQPDHRLFRLIAVTRYKALEATDISFHGVRHVSIVLSLVRSVESIFSFIDHCGPVSETLTTLPSPALKVVSVIDSQSLQVEQERYKALWNMRSACVSSEVIFGTLHLCWRLFHSQSMPSPICHVMFDIT